MEGKKEKKEKDPAKKEVKKIAKKAVKKAMKGAYPSLQHAAVGESAYLKTILDPVNVVGVKIPDEVTTPSYTVQTLTKFILTTNSGAGGNIGAGFWRIVGSTLGATGYATLAASATAQQYGPAVAVASPWAIQFVSQCASYRLVSAKATMTYLGAPNNVSGRFLLAFVSPYSLLATTAGNVALSGVGAGQNLLQNDKLVDVPASKLYAEARYVPLDPLAASYETSGSNAFNTQRAGAATYGQFIGILDGAPTGQSIEVNIWENYECIPQTSLVNLVEPTPSLSDPMEMAAAANVLSSVPTIPTMQSLPDMLNGSAQAAPTGVMSALSLGNSASSTKAPQVTESSEAGFTEKLLSGAGSLIDAGRKALPLVTSIAAML